MKIWIAQIIGFIGLFTAVLSFQQKQRKGILFFQILASAAYFFHFLLLGALTGAVMNIIGATRNWVFYHKDKPWANKIVWLYFFLAIYTLSTALTWKNAYSLLPMIGMYAGTVSYWLKTPKYIRITILLSPPCWFTYNLICGSIPGMLTEIFTAVSVIIALIRFDLLKQPQNQNKN
jgi:hypothetical protein